MEEYLSILNKEDFGSEIYDLLWDNWNSIKFLDKKEIITIEDKNTIKRRICRVIRYISQVWEEDEFEKNINYIIFVIKNELQNQDIFITLKEEVYQDIERKNIEKKKNQELDNLIEIIKEKARNGEKKEDHLELQDKFKKLMGEIEGAIGHKHFIIYGRIFNNLWKN